MSDVVGRLFREFAVTLATTIVISAVVSLTLTASLSALWLKRDPHAGVPSAAPRTRFAALAESWRNGFARVIDRYDSTLRWVLDHQRPVLVIAVASSPTALLYVVIPKDRSPAQARQIRPTPARESSCSRRWADPAVDRGKDP
jgi:multidrug efflux pump